MCVMLIFSQLKNTISNQDNLGRHSSCVQKKHRCFYSIAEILFLLTMVYAKFKITIMQQSSHKYFILYHSIVYYKGTVF